MSGRGVVVHDVMAFAGAYYTCDVEVRKRASLFMIKCLLYFGGFDVVCFCGTGEG